jgi:hypothetical protein
MRAVNGFIAERIWAVLITPCLVSPGSPAMIWTPASTPDSLSRVSALRVSSRVWPRFTRSSTGSSRV